MRRDSGGFRMLPRWKSGLTQVWKSPPPSRALVILTPLPAAIERIRQRYDPAAALGVPAHVTIMYPFLPPADITGGVNQELKTLAGQHVRFRYRLGGLLDWPDDVLVIAVEPASAFQALTAAVHDNWGLDPYAGQIPIDEIVPHVTVGSGVPVTARRHLADLSMEDSTDAEAASLHLLLEATYVDSSNRPRARCCAAVT